MFYLFLVRPPVSLRMLSCSLEINSWKEALTADIDVNRANMSTALPHQLMLQMTYHWLLIILHRPFYRRRKDETGYEIDHVKVRVFRQHCAFTSPHPYAP